jgi:hypothetical protein
MISGLFMTARPDKSGPGTGLGVLAVVLKIAGIVSFLAATACAKDAPLTAIVLYDRPDGAAYVQISGLTVNSKNELRLCNGASRFDKKAYGKLPKVQFRSAKSLERSADGVLMLTNETEAVCVLPSGLGFEQKAELTAAEAGEQAVLQGTVVSSSSKQTNEIPAFKPGMQIIFVAAPDAEMAEYLLAQRARSIGGWQRFLKEYPSSSRTADAKKALAVLFEESAEAALAAYRKSVAVQFPQLPQLKRAQEQAEQAIQVMGAYSPATNLIGQVHNELNTLIENDRAELEGYRKALAEHTPGYVLLVAAKRHNNELLEIDPKYTPAFSLQTELLNEENHLESALQNAEAQLAASNYDDAFKAVSRYRFFAPELPRVNSVVDAVYKFHFDRGQQFVQQKDWAGAEAEFRKATETKPDNKEAQAALKNAETELLHARDQEAADEALEQSKGYAEQKQFIEAYKVLADLPDSQRALVEDELGALKPDFVTAAFQQAQKLQSVHLPIRGRIDEDAVREAYDLLVRASSVSDDQSIKLKLDLLSDKISGYYVELAKRYLAKPLASGVGLGWCYLATARRFKQNLDTVRDEQNRYESAYQMRSRLSISIKFRDQTSRRESAGFADQLTDGIATSLEGLGVKVLRHTSENPDAIPANFELVGEILQDRISKDPKQETLQSQYRAGTREVKNEAWVKANHEFEAAQQELTNAQQSLALAVAHNKKNEMAAAKEVISKAQKKLEDTRNQRDALEQTVPEDVVKPYNYIKTTYDVTAVIELGFRITDRSGNLIEPTVPVNKKSQKPFVVLENVKSEDTDGIKAQDRPPDEAQIREELEIQARDTLVKAVREKVAELPEKILKEAERRVQASDLDGAAEEYILYLNAAPGAPAVGREEAKRFLAEHFNVIVDTGS